MPGRKEVNIDIKISHDEMHFIIACQLLTLDIMGNAPLAEWLETSAKVVETANIIGYEDFCKFIDRFSTQYQLVCKEEKES